MIGDNVLVGWRVGFDTDLGLPDSYTCNSLMGATPSLVVSAICSCTFNLLVGEPVKSTKLLMCLVQGTTCFPIFYAVGNSYISHIRLRFHCSLGDAVGI